ncbi:hypothetical protein KBC99_02910, partial [Candidatus Saccharibacteria bacterium]|nr:hypothetical protein [Candidatus Saccharibacteria bacterium]
TELTNSKSYLDSLLGEPTKLFVTPYCESNASVESAAQALYQSVRNCEPAVNVKASFNRWSLKSLIVENTTTDAQILNMINQAKASNGWLILVWHEIDGDNKNAWSVSKATLTRQLQLIKDSGITVVPTQTAINESMGL